MAPAATAARFAEELRRQCARRGSIAQVCLATGINRQQFNKYLSGSILPSVRNMQKICACFGVSVEQLMGGGAASSADVTVAAPEPVHPGPELPPSQPAVPPPSERSANVLPLGHYDCYFPLHAESPLVVRWLLTLRMREGHLTFTCRENDRLLAAGRRGGTASKYHGLVFTGPREAHFVATSAVQLHQPGVIAVNTLPVLGRTYYSGLALTRRLDGPLAITAALRYRGHTIRVRKALDGIGILSLDEPDLDPLIAQMMRAAPAAGANWMQSVNGKSLRRVSPSGGLGLSAAKAARSLAG